MASWVLTWGRARGWPGWFVHHWVVVCAGGMSKALPLLLTPQKWQSGFASFSILYTICPIPHMHMVTSSPFLFPCICCWKRCLSRCRHCSEGSRVPGPSPSQSLLLCSGLIQVWLARYPHRPPFPRKSFWHLALRSLHGASSQPLGVSAGLWGLGFL